MRNVVQLSSCILDLQRDAVRLPPRPMAIRNADYEDQFDFTTLFCDVFWDQSGEGVVLLGPPLLNLLGHPGLEFRALPSGATCDPAMTHRFWMDQVNLPVPQGTVGIELRSGNACFTLSIQPNLSHLFKDRRAVFTMNRNNDLAWIRDWVKFQRDEHGCDGILLYDHQSDAYALPDLHDTIQSVHADLQVAVLSWPFPYGVFDGRHELTYNIYDSFYCQAVIFEHARRRFLGHARSVLNADVDELVLARSGESVFAMVEASETGYLNFGGWWILNRGGAAGGPRRHKNYFYRKKGNSDSTEPKWAVVPGRVGEKMQWSVHWIAGMPSDMTSARVNLRHFKPINTDWDVDTHLLPTRRTEAADFGVDDIEIDAELQESLQRVFADDQEPARAEAAGSPEVRALRLRLSSGTAAALGDNDAALAMAREAVALLPEHPGLRLHLADLLARSGATGTAGDECQRAAALREADPYYHYQLARVAFARGDSERVVPHLLEAVELATDFVEARYTLFRELRSSALDSQAAALAARWAAIAPDTAIAQETAARMCWEAGQAGQAIRSARRAIVIEPRWTAYHFLAAACLAAGETAAAAEAQQTAIVLADRDMPVRAAPTPLEGLIFPFALALEPIELPMQLASIATQAGRLRDAEAAARDAIARDPTSPKGYFALAKALSARGEAAAAADAFAKSLALMQYQIELTARSQRAPGERDLVYSFTQLQLARMLIWGQQSERAIRELRELFQSGRARLQYRLEALDLLFGLAAFDEAERHIGAMRTAGITHWRLEWAAAGVELHRGRLSEAVAACASAVALDPDNDFLHHQLGLLHVRQQNWTDAAVAFRRAAALNPKNADAFRELSTVLLKLDQDEDAVTAARQAVALRPDHAGWHNHLGNLLMRQKAWAEAAAEFDRALAIDPGHTFAQTQLLKLQARLPQS